MGDVISSHIKLVDDQGYATPAWWRFFGDVSAGQSGIVFVNDAPYSATGDGTTDDSGAFRSAISDHPGKKIYVRTPSVGYFIGSNIPMTPGTHLFGESKWATKMILGGNFDMFTSDDGNAWTDLYLDGNSMTGNLITIPAAKGQQTATRVRATNCVGAPISFADTTSGEGFCATDCLAFAKPGSGHYAVEIQDAVQSSAFPRHFVNFETGGEPSFKFGGSNGTFVTGSFLGDLLYSANTQDVQIGASRLRGLTSPFVIRGAFNSIIGCDVFPKIQLAAGCQACTIGPNAYNSNGTPTDPPVDDQSGFSSNLVYHYDYAYTATFSTSGGGSSLGSGSLVAIYNRQGNVVTGTIQMSVAGGIGGTIIGPGIIQFALPPGAPLLTGFSQFFGNCRGIHSGTSYFGVPGVATGAGQVVAMYRDDATGGFTASNPAVWGGGDTFNVSFQYTV